MTELERGRQFKQQHEHGCGGPVQIESPGTPDGPTRLTCNGCGTICDVLVPADEARAVVVAALLAFGCAEAEILRLTASGVGVAEIDSMIRAIEQMPRETRRH
jgi:hypothetical protein